MVRAAHVPGRTTMALLGLAALPATHAMREAVLSRRSALLGAVLAAAPVPRYSALRAEGPLGQAEGLQTEGLQASRAKCRTLAIGEMLGETREACEARVADTPQQSMLSDGAKTSPLIEQLKQRTAANKDYNSLYVKTVTAGANSGVYDAERNLRLVRLDGVPKLLAPDDIKKLEVAARPRPRPRLQPYASRLQSCVCTLQPYAPRRGATRSSAPTMRRCRASSPKARPPASSTPRCAARRLLWLLAQFVSESLERTSSLHVYHLEPRYRLLYTFNDMWPAVFPLTFLFSPPV